MENVNLKEVLIERFYLSELQCHTLIVVSKMKTKIIEKFPYM